MRHLSDKWNMVVDPDTAKVEPLGKAHRTGVVCCPYRRSQTVVDIVRPAHGLVIVRELLNGDDRAKDFTLDVLVVLLEASQNCCLVKIAARLNDVTANCDFGVVWQALDEALDSLELVDVVDRAKQNVITVRCSGLGVGLDLGNELGYESLTNVTVNLNTSRSGAVLTRVEESGSNYGCSSTVEICICKN